MIFFLTKDQFLKKKNRSFFSVIKKDFKKNLKLLLSLIIKVLHLMKYESELGHLKVM